MPTNHNETLLERYQREHRVYEGMKMSKAEKLAGFPARIVQTLEDMADREPKGNRGPWQYSDGDQMQDDAEAFLKELLRLSAINAELIEALEDTLQSLCWLAFGECRNVTSRPLLSALQAEEKSRAAIAKAQGEQL